MNVFIMLGLGLIGFGIVQELSKKGKLPNVLPTAQNKTTETVTTTETVSPVAQPKPKE